MGKWSQEAFTAAKGYDYLRANRHAMRNVSIQMVIALVQVQLSDANEWWHESTISRRDDWTLETYFYAATAGFVVLAALTLCWLERLSKPDAKRNSKGFRTRPRPSDTVHFTLGPSRTEHSKSCRTSPQETAEARTGSPGERYLR